MRSVNGYASKVKNGISFSLILVNR